MYEVCFQLTCDIVNIPIAVYASKDRILFEKEENKLIVFECTVHKRIQKHIKHSVHNKIRYVVIYDTYVCILEKMVRPSVFRIL